MDQWQKAAAVAGKVAPVPRPNQKPKLSAKLAQPTLAVQGAGGKAKVGVGGSKMIAAMHSKSHPQKDKRR